MDFNQTEGTMWKVIKFFNKRLNEMLCVRLKIKIRRGRFPNIEKNTFNVMHNKAWGSVHPEYDNVFTTKCVDLGNPITIDTKREQSCGRGFWGEHIVKDWISGMFMGRVTPKIHNVTVEFDLLQKGAFDAVWFIKDSKRYREVDIERTDNQILVSVHDGDSSSEGRKLYNHAYPLPQSKVRFTFKFGWFTRVYMNDVLIFVGLQWRLKGWATFIVNSGVLPSAEERSEGTLKVYNIEHYE
mgnify:CR=1 FL=1